MLIEIRQQTGVEAPELSRLPPLPFELEYLWKRYVDLDKKRQVGMAVNALTWSDIRAYCELMGVKMRPWEIETIVAIDDAYMDVRYNGKATAAASAKALREQVPAKKGKS